MYRSLMYIDAVSSAALHEPKMLILAALAKGRRRGCGLFAETLSEGRVTLRVATLCTALPTSTPTNTSTLS
jgi:hypothetical protein